MSKFSCLTGHPVEVKIILNCAHSKTLKSVTEIYTPNPGMPGRNLKREREEGVGFFILIFIKAKTLNQNFKKKLMKLPPLLHKPLVVCILTITL